MTFKINELAGNEGANKAKTRVGRGIGCTKGKTCGRGVKGQKSRSGVAIKGFEGGQMPIFRRLPKRGFNNYNRKNFEVINLSKLEDAIKDKKLDASKNIDTKALIDAGLAKGNLDGVKILGTGEISAKVNISADKASESAIKSIEKAGGKFSIEDKSAQPSQKAKKSIKSEDGSKQKSAKEPVAKKKTTSSKK